MVTRVEVRPALYQWAMERARGEVESYMARFPKLEDWIAGNSFPTLKQVEDFASATHAPVGFFFLPEPPDEPLPVADFRTIDGKDVGSPSADLLDTIYICQQRQEWYQDFARSTGEDAKAFVGSLDLECSPVKAACLISTELQIDLNARMECSTWSEALRLLIEQCEEAGILVMISGIVGNNTRRVLNPNEFRGLCLSDGYAPLVFINGADSKSAQMFTLMHEVAHLWLGQGGLSNASLNSQEGSRLETWCNAVAAEILVPLTALGSELNQGAKLEEEVSRLCRLFKVSSLVVIRRLLDAGHLNQRQFRKAYDAELQRVLALKKKSAGGGDFYKTEAVRVSKRFARALLVSTYEGYTLYRDASRLLGIKKAATMDEFAARLGVN